MLRDNLLIKVNIVTDCGAIYLKPHLQIDFKNQTWLGKMNGRKDNLKGKPRDFTTTRARKDYPATEWNIERPFKRSTANRITDL